MPPVVEFKVPIVESKKGTLLYNGEFKKNKKEKKPTMGKCFIEARVGYL